MHTVIESPAYLRHAAEAGATANEMMKIKLAIAANPVMGQIMPGAGGARKVRFARGGKGKSGSYRVITYHAADDVPTVLLDIYGKGDKVNLTKAERNTLADILSTLADDYRRSVKERLERTKTGRG